MGHVGLTLAVAALESDPLRLGVFHKVLPPVDWGHRDALCCAERAPAVAVGERGALVSGNVDEGVEEEVSDAFGQGWPPGLAAWMGWDVPEVRKCSTCWFL